MVLHLVTDNKVICCYWLCGIGERLMSESSAWKLVSVYLVCGFGFRGVVSGSYSSYRWNNWHAARCSLCSRVLPATNRAAVHYHRHLPSHQFWHNVNCRLCWIRDVKSNSKPQDAFTLNTSYRCTGWEDSHTYITSALSRKLSRQVSTSRTGEWWCINSLTRCNMRFKSMRTGIKVIKQQLRVVKSPNHHLLHVWASTPTPTTCTRIFKAGLANTTL